VAGQQQQQQQEEAEREGVKPVERMIAATCPAPHLLGAREFFATQREAFAAADRLNQAMPLARQPVVVMSAVPAEALLAPSATPAAANSACSDSHGTSSSSSMHRSKESPSKGAEQAQPAGPADFLSRRFTQKTCPVADSSTYRLPAKRQLEEVADEELVAEQQRKREQQADAQRLAREQYQAVLRAHQLAAAEAQEGERAPAMAGRQRVVAGLERDHCAGGSSGKAGAATLAAQAPTAVVEHEVERRHEAVRTFCVERRGR
jgi:hypothetical protein